MGYHSPVVNVFKRIQMFSSLSPFGEIQFFIGLQTLLFKNYFLARFQSEGKIRYTPVLTYIMFL